MAPRNELDAVMDAAERKRAATHKATRAPAPQAEEGPDLLAEMDAILGPRESPPAVAPKAPKPNPWALEEGTDFYEREELIARAKMADRERSRRIIGGEVGDDDDLLAVMDTLLEGAQWTVPTEPQAPLTSAVAAPALEEEEDDDALDEDDDDEEFDDDDDDALDGLADTGGYDDDDDDWDDED